MSGKLTSVTAYFLIALIFGAGARPLLVLRLLLRKRPRVARPYYLNDNHTLNNNICQKSLIYSSLVFSIAKKKRELSNYDATVLRIKALLKELRAVPNLNIL